MLHCIPGMGGGGAERQLAYLTGPLTERGWDVHVALGAGGPNLARLRAGGAIVHFLRGDGNHDPRIAAQLWRVFSDVRPDIAQTWFIQMDLLAGTIACVRRVPWIFSERSSEMAYPSSLKNRLRLLIGAKADVVVANSSAGQDYWRRHPAAARATVVIPNAVPLSEIDDTAPDVPAGLPLEPDDFVVLFAGRFGPEKNIGALVDALAALPEGQTPWRAVLCGDGPLRESIMKDIDRRGIAGRVFAPGYVDHLWPLMKRANVLVAPGHFEGRPNTIIEAMAAGCPVVVSDIYANREILDESSALWIDPRNPMSIRDAIENVRTNPAAARRRAAAARAAIAPFSIPAAATAYDRIYRAVLNGAAVEAAG